MKRKPLNLDTANLADGEDLTFTSTRHVLAKTSAASDATPRAIVAYGRPVPDTRPQSVPQKRRGKKAEKSNILPAADDVAAPVADAPARPQRSVYEMCGIKESSYRYLEKTFTEYADNIALMDSQTLYDHAYDAGVHPSQSRSNLLDILEEKYIKVHPTQKAEAARVRQADRDSLSAGELALNGDYRQRAARRRKLAREHGEGMSLHERAVAIMQRGR